MITTEQLNKLREYLATHHIPSGLGTKEEACSIAAINLCLTGELTDSIPDCMSPVIGGWIIRIQDKMPDSIRNSDKWKELLPLAAGTGRTKEKERIEIIIRLMWNELSRVQYIADKYGFGKEWLEMTNNKNKESSLKARRAAASYSVDADLKSRRSADAYAYAFAAAFAAASDSDSDSDYYYDAAYAYAYAVAYDADNYWQRHDPCGLLEKLINV